MLSKLAKVLAAPAVIGVLGIPAIANAAPHPHVTASAVTHLTNHPDIGDSGNTWAYDTLTRTASVTLIGPVTVNKCGSGATTCYEYTGRLSDTGTARALTRVTSPGAQAVRIHGTPTATVRGNATLNFDASSNAPTGALVPRSLSGVPYPPKQTTTNWVKQFFPSNTRFGTISMPTWRWTYVAARDCQTWVDAYNVSRSNSGDITGVSYCHNRPHPRVIRLSGGRAYAVTPTRENYSWVQNGPSWDRLTIVGPGPINGHVGYVNAMHAGRVTAYYTGLLSGHTYVVTIQPQRTKGGAPAGPSGRVTFVTK